MSRGMEELAERIVGRLSDHIDFDLIAQCDCFDSGAKDAVIDILTEALEEPAYTDRPDTKPAQELTVGDLIQLEGTSFTLPVEEVILNYPEGNQVMIKSVNRIHIIFKWDEPVRMYYLGN